MAIISANLLQVQQLESCMQQATGNDRATPDEWNWCAGHFVDPDILPDTNAYLPRDSTPPLSAGAFLDAMRQFQLDAAQASNLNGGGGIPDCGGGSVYKYGGKYSCEPQKKTTAPSGGATGNGSGGATGNGVLGKTDCAFCQKLATNPLLFVVLAVVGFFVVKEARG